MSSRKNWPFYTQKRKEIHSRNWRPDKVDQETTSGSLIFLRKQSHKKDPKQLMEKNQTNGVVLSETFLLDKKTQGKASVKGVAFPPKAEKHHEVET